MNPKPKPQNGMHNLIKHGCKMGTQGGFCKLKVLGRFNFVLSAGSFNQAAIEREIVQG